MALSSGSAFVASLCLQNAFPSNNSGLDKAHNILLYDKWTRIVALRKGLLTPFADVQDDVGSGAETADIGRFLKNVGSSDGAKPFRTISLVDLVKSVIVAQIFK
jgi:hypothetical protein